VPAQTMTLSGFGVAIAWPVALVESKADQGSVVLSFRNMGKLPVTSELKCLEKGFSVTCAPARPRGEGT
jgi:hypothetical protein